MMRKVVGVLMVVLGVFLFLADFSLATPDTPQIVRSERSQNVEPVTQNEAAPKISAVEPLFDFGEVRQGEKVEHVFQIQNTGMADLLITKATGS
jgi:hypothetical protein